VDALQEPPPHFEVKLPVVTYRNASWYRVHLRAYDALYFDVEGTSRFNAPDRSFGVLYASEAAEGACAEAFLRRRRRPLRVTEDQLHRRALSRMEWTELRLADFTSVRLTYLGLDARIASGDCYDLAQRWSKWIHAHPDQVDGICYFARHAPALRSIALFERAGLPAAQEIVVASFMPTPGSLSVEARRLIELFEVDIV
jgi:hypothetical protein